MQYIADHSLKQLNTFGIDVQCRHFFSVDDEVSLTQLLSDEKFQELKKSYPDFLVLGGGSNILFTEDVNGIVLQIAIEGIQLLTEREEQVVVRAGAGTPWHSFVENAIEHGWGGVENLSCIPGTVGAAPIQNIGAYGVEVANVIETVHAIDLLNNQKVSFCSRDCQFGYRESFFKKEGKGRYLITTVDFALTKNAKLNLDYGAIREELAIWGIRNPSIEDVSNAVCRIRASKLPSPAEIGNAGSFFKNPVVSSAQLELIKGKQETVPSHPTGGGSKIPAGWLIEKAGWKGYREGDAGCHEKQALVLVNYGNATGKEILQLAEKIQKSVFQQFGIELEREVNVFPSRGK